MKVPWLTDELSYSPMPPLLADKFDNRRYRED
jgi:hypothetical protein